MKPGQTVIIPVQFLPFQVETSFFPSPLRLVALLSLLLWIWTLISLFIHVLFLFLFLFLFLSSFSPSSEATGVLCVLPTPS